MRRETGGLSLRSTCKYKHHIVHAIQLILLACQPQPSFPLLRMAYMPRWSTIILIFRLYPFIVRSSSEWRFLTVPDNITARYGRRRWALSSLRLSLRMCDFRGCCSVNFLIRRISARWALQTKEAITRLQVVCNIIIGFRRLSALRLYVKASHSDLSQ